MKKVTLAGGNLYRVAAIHLGDATRWDEIARLNGMTDPVFYGLRTLRLPSKGTTKVMSPARV